MEEFNLEISCFKSWSEWVFICEMMTPNLGALQALKTSFQKEKLPRSSYSSFLLESLLNTREKLESALSNLDQILLRGSKFNQISVLATRQFLGHYLTLKFKENTPLEGILLDIIRTISQLSDIYQDSHKMNKSIRQVLEIINMKEGLFISEVRHMATHKQMPSRTLVQRSVEYLLLFFIENYWVKIYKKVKSGNKETMLFKKSFETFKEEIKKILSQFESRDDLEGILREMKINLRKNRFKCAILLSEVLRRFLNQELEGQKEKMEILMETIFRIFDLKEKKIVGKLLKFPFIRYKLLRIISLKSLNPFYEEVTKGFLARFYAKNDKAMVFMKKMEAEVFSKPENEPKFYSSEEIEAFLLENQQKFPSILL